LVQWLAHSDHLKICSENHVWQEFSASNFLNVPKIRFSKCQSLQPINSD
jgi:hypothetical protein